MKKFLTLAVVCLSLATMSISAEAAKRFGGGMSFGRSAPTFVQKAPASAGFTYSRPQSAQPRQATQNAQTATPTTQRPSMMRSILGGLAAGLGIAALLSLLGINGAGIANFITVLLLVLVVFFVVRLVLARKQVASSESREPVQDWTSQRVETPTMTTPSPEPATSASTYAREKQEPVGEVRRGSVLDELLKGQTSTAGESVGATDITPADFDHEAFLKEAANQYVKLQKAWASGSVLDISDFTSNDIFIALTHQLRERGNEKFDIEVENLKNELLGIAQENNQYVAVVRFNADIVVNGEKEVADELWILEKPVEGNAGWILSGIKQNSPESH